MRGLVLIKYLTLMSNEFLIRAEGQQGVFVDESTCADGTVHLCCDVYDEEGERVFHTELSIESTPEDISDFLIQSAEQVLNDSNDEISLEAAYEIAEDLRMEAKKLKSKNHLSWARSD